MALSVYTATTVEPVSIDLARRHLNITDHDDDILIERWIKSARTQVENFTRRRMITQTVEETFNGFPDPIRLQVAPVQSVTQIGYTDTAGASQVVASSIYTTDLNNVPPRVYEAHSQVWPSTQDVRNSVTVRYVVGYGDDGDAVPAPLVDAMLLMIGDMDEYRESSSWQTIRPIPNSANALMLAYVWN
jgi:uncharacterized phiE125 gp8 family phage protein